MRWWNTNYKYRRQITIAANASVATPQYFPINALTGLDITSLISAGKIRSDKKDLRIIQYVSGVPTELVRDYVDNTDVFFGLQSQINANAKDLTYFIYYGYPSESSSKQASAAADFNGIYFLGPSPDANYKGIWHMRDGSGTTVTDETGNNNGGMNGASTWVTDKYGRSVHLDQASNNAYIDLGGAAMYDVAAPFTIEGIWNADALRYGYLWNKKNNGSSNSNHVWIDPVAGPNDVFTLTTDDSGHADSIGANEAYWVAGTPYYFSFVYDGSTMYWYANGVLKWSGGHTTHPASNGNNLLLGFDYDGAKVQMYQGKIQHIAFSNTARSSFPQGLAVGSPPTITSAAEESLKGFGFII